MTSRSSASRCPKSTLNWKIAPRPRWESRRSLWARRPKPRPGACPSQPKHQPKPQRNVSTPTTVQTPSLRSQKTSAHTRSSRLCSINHQRPLSRAKSHGTIFLHAMSVTGFGIEQLYGSAWQFTLSKLDVERTIQFHEPHPIPKIPFRIMRQCGRRLARAYG